MAIEKVKSLRKELHMYPELSGMETETARRIKKFILENHDPRIIENIGGNGLAVIHEFSNGGPNIVIRCELDALPIKEVNDFEHRSVNKGISHKCGHDGHMAIVAGLIFWLKEQDFRNGKVILLFQPAEETGKGAPTVLNDDRFNELNPDYIFALHNIPHQPTHSIIILNDSFSATVQSVAIQLKGKESHSAEPENGVNPAMCIADLTQKLNKLNNNDPMKADFTLCVPIYTSMGVNLMAFLRGLVKCIILCEAAMFGIGAGLQSPALHHADYDFPEEIIETGMSMFNGIIERLLTNKE